MAEIGIDRGAAIFFFSDHVQRLQNACVAVVDLSTARPLIVLQSNGGAAPNSASGKIGRPAASGRTKKCAATIVDGSRTFGKAVVADHLPAGPSATALLRLTTLDIYNAIGAHSLQGRPGARFRAPDHRRCSRTANQKEATDQAGPQGAQRSEPARGISKAEGRRA